MVYRLLAWSGVWWVGPTIRYRIQIVSSASTNLKMELVHRLTNIPRFSKVVGIQGLRQLCPPLDPPLVDMYKDKLK